MTTPLRLGPVKMAASAEVFDSAGTLSVMIDGWDAFFLQKLDFSERDEDPPLFIDAAQDELHQALCYGVGAMVDPNIIGGESIELVIQMAGNLLHSLEMTLRGHQDQIEALVAIRDRLLTPMPS